MKITLNNFELFMAGCVGLRRRINSIGRKETIKILKEEEFGWEIHIEAACKEIAAAKALDLYWDGSVNTFKAPDLTKIQVRSTNRENGSLIIRQKDNDEEKFLLVTGKSPTYNIIGFIKGIDGKQSKWLRSPNNDIPAWFVPQEALRKIEELKT